MFVFLQAELFLRITAWLGVSCLYGRPGAAGEFDPLCKAGRACLQDGEAAGGLLTPSSADALLSFEADRIKDLLDEGVIGEAQRPAVLGVLMLALW